MAQLIQLEQTGAVSFTGISINELVNKRVIPGGFVTETNPWGDIHGLSSTDGTSYTITLTAVPDWASQQFNHTYSKTGTVSYNSGTKVLSLISSSIMAQKGFTLLETLLGLAIFTLLLTVAARGAVSIDEFYKGKRLGRDLDALRKSLENYYVAEGSFPADISDLCPYLPANWTIENPFCYSYVLSIAGAVARIDTPIPNTISPSYLPNTQSYKNNGIKYVPTEVFIPRLNFNARWERVYEMGWKASQ